MSEEISNITDMLDALIEEYGEWVPALVGDVKDIQEAVQELSDRVGAADYADYAEAAESFE